MLNQITKSNVPLKFKVLKSATDMDTKSIATTNINKLNDTDVSTVEYCKLDKWINGLINVPFGQYVIYQLIIKIHLKHIQYLQNIYDIRWSNLWSRRC